MRILHVNKFLYRRGGAEGYMLDVAALQRSAGHEVGFFGMDHPENETPQPLGRTFPSFVELEPPPVGGPASRPRPDGVVELQRPRDRAGDPRVPA